MSDKQNPLHGPPTPETPPPHDAVTVQFRDDWLPHAGFGDGGETVALSAQRERGRYRSNAERATELYQLNVTAVGPHEFWNRAPATVPNAAESAPMLGPNQTSIGTPPLPGAHPATMPPPAANPTLWITNERQAFAIWEASYGRVHERSVPVGAGSFDLRSFVAGTAGIKDRQAFAAVHTAFHETFGGRDVNAEYERSPARGPFGGVTASLEASVTRSVAGLEVRPEAAVAAATFVGRRGIEEAAVAAGLGVTVGKHLATQPQPVFVPNAEGHAPMTTPTVGATPIAGVMQAGGWSLAARAKETFYPTGDNRFIEGARPSRAVTSVRLDGSYAVSPAVTAVTGVQISDNPSHEPHHGVPDSGPRRNVTINAGIHVKF